MSPRPRRRLWTRVLFVVVATILLLEVVLQVGAVVVWLGQRGRALDATNASGRTVLCVGDSWTHGIGSLDFATGSYPARLENYLRQHVAADWQVLNGGQSGQNSRDVLERLPGQLERARPAWVLVLVGQNDFWSRPDRLVLEPGAVPMDPGAFRWRFRTGRLIAWLAGKWSGAGQAGGGAAEPRAGVAPPWETDDASWQLVRPPSRGRALPDEEWADDPETNLVLRRARDEQAVKRFDAAREVLEERAARQPEDPRVFADLANLRRKMADVEPAREMLAALETGYAEHRSAWWAISWARALANVADRTEACEQIGRLSAEWPDDAELAGLYAHALFLVDDVDAARRRIEAAWTLEPSAGLAQIRYLVWRGDGGRPTAEALVGGYLLDNDARQFAGRCRAVLQLRPEDRSAMDEVIAAADCDSGQRARLVEIVAWVAADLETDGMAGGGEASATLEAHLEQIRAVVAGAGARCAFLTYPLPNSGVEELARVARRLDIPFLPVYELYPGQDWARLKAPDGHCNDAGYALMAEMVGLWLAPLLEATAFEPPAGLWRSDAGQLTLGLSPGGRGFLQAEPLVWRTEGAAIALSLDKGTELVFSFGIDGDRMELRDPADQVHEFARVR